MSSKEIFDFGFTTMSVEEVVDSHVEPIDLAEALNGLVSMIEPLLANLEKNPDKDYIKWPNRAEAISSFRKRIQEYVDDKING